MPADFPEMFESRVHTLVQDETEAPHLDGIRELDTEVIEVGSGAASESNLIHIPITTFRPGVLVNNTTYPIPTVAYSDTGMTLHLDKFQTKATSLSDDQTIGSSYKQIDSVTKGHVDDLKETKFKKAMHAIAPSADGGAKQKFVIQATGEEVTPGGRKRLLWKDLVTARQRADDQRCKKKGRRLVLCSDHENDLLIDNSSKYADKLADYLAGTIKGTLAGFEIFVNMDNPMYTEAGVKRPYGAVPNATDRNATVFFHPENCVKKTGMTKQYFSPSSGDTTTQTNMLNYRHYYIALPVMDQYIGAII